ncbi:ABC transporter ATP-binding protein [Paeniglutamicibacter sulfureus]|uniref:ABC-2 type transport system ATP-binding protein n=1 Tax=Paeniglutamicibacter sulfureus TaxID=43666 RepID=A0ABU2BL32_9MICC|nr:ATP-binding cassette domain-containing protein [Paeniglutamicibacter sulfureus]MDR7359347.1 ABC-2 type transport system ATP-binding protein [Paeniglutamicibacter sulfureus]
MLEVEGLTRRFGDRTVLEDVSFSVPANGMTGFVGANGAGKTTTMRIIMGVLKSHSGSVYFNGTQIADADRARFGYMPEERGLYPKQQVLDQLQYLGQLHGMSRADARSEALDLLDRFGIADRTKDKLESLSLGNQQRVQVAASLMHHPTALILDEPFSGLDPLAVDSMTSLLAERAATGVPILFSSHQLDLIDQLCDNLVVLAGGKIVASGTAADLRARASAKHVVVTPPDAGWLREQPGVSVLDVAGPRALVEFADDATAQRVLRAAVARGAVTEFAPQRPSLAEIYREVIR